MTSPGRSGAGGSRPAAGRDAAASPRRRTWRTWALSAAILLLAGGGLWGVRSWVARSGERDELLAQFVKAHDEVKKRFGSRDLIGAREWLEAEMPLKDE